MRSPAVGYHPPPHRIRLDIEYVEAFDRLDNLAAHLLIETAPRFGLDASASHLGERWPDGRYDSLQLGDCNFVYRFAQGTWGEFRAGLGLNWLRDDDATNLGFNFTIKPDGGLFYHGGGVGLEWKF